MDHKTQCGKGANSSQIVLESMQPQILEGYFGENWQFDSKIYMECRVPKKNQGRLE